MKAILQAENLKYRHSIWKLFFFLIPVIPCIIGSVNYYQNLEILKEGWFDLWTQHTLFYAFFFFSPLIAIASSFLWRVEHKGKNWNLFMSVPVNTAALYCAKFLILVRLILEMQVIVGILFIISGKILGLQGWVPPVILWWLIRGTFGALVIAAVQMLISMLIHNFAVPVMIGFLGGICGYLISSYGYGAYFPYSQLMMGMNSNKTKDVLIQGNATFFSVILFYIIFFTFVSIFLLKNRDVKTQ